LKESFVRLADERASQEAFPQPFRLNVLLGHRVNAGFRVASLFFLGMDVILDFYSVFAIVDVVL
jgi:hypothetical protein